MLEKMNAWVINEVGRGYAGEYVRVYFECMTMTDAKRGKTLAAVVAIRGIDGEEVDYYGLEMYGCSYHEEYPYMPSMNGKTFMRLVRIPSDLEKWSNTMEALHEVEPPAFNPDYDEQKAKLVNEVERALDKARELVDRLPLTDTEKDRLDDVCFLSVSAVEGLHGYSVKEGRVVHETARGMEYINESGVTDVFSPSAAQKWRSLLR